MTAHPPHRRLPRRLAGGLSVALLVLGCAEAGETGAVDAARAPTASPAEATTAASFAPDTPASAAPPPRKELDVAAVLAAIPEDPPPKSIIRDTHYFVSNEHEPELFYGPARRVSGGALLGVGAEQNYLLAGWTRPEVMVLMDFDQWVVDLHRIYGLAFLRAKTPGAFVDLWGKPGSDALEAEVPSLGQTEEEKKRLLHVFRISRVGVHARMLMLRTRFGNHSVPSFVTDAGQYAHLVDLHRRGHVRALRGDFTGNLAMAGVADAMRTLGQPVRTVYISNVEHYFDYGTGLGRNLTGLPYDEASVILRTIPINNTEYYYVLQRAADFRAWVDDRKAVRLADLMMGGRLTQVADGSWTLAGPP